MASDAGDDRVSDFLDQWAAVRPDLDVSPMGIIGRLSRAAEVTGRQVRAYFDQHGLSRSEFDVLATLRRSGAPYRLTPGELTAATMSSAATVSNRLNDLERRALVTRQVDPANRRSIQVSLTPAGLDLVDGIVEGHLANERTVLDGLTATEQAELARLLAKLLASLGDTRA